MKSARLVKLTLLGLAGTLLLFPLCLVHSNITQDLFCCGLVLLISLLHTLSCQVEELPSFTSLIILDILALFLASTLVPHNHRGLGQLTACKSNVKNLATSLEMYSTDNAGHYPTSLAPLTPNYLKKLPQCPSAQKVTYGYVRAETPDAYTLWCGGCYHHASGINEPNYPQYTSYSGLLVP